jgi:nucleoside recognition membrane protein YjiH
MFILFGIVAVIAIGFLIAANFYPPLKTRLAKWIVIVEGLVATGIYWFGQATEVLQEAQKAGYLPSQWLGYLPYIFMAYLVFKKFQGDAAVKKASKIEAKK